MKFTAQSLLWIAICGLLYACGSPSSPSQSSTEPVESSPPKPELSLGQKVYAKHCLVCHMNKGQGVPGLNPPLVDTDWVSGDKTRLIEVVLQGLNGPIEVNGESYSGAMMGFAYLSDEEVAAVLSHIRSSFGNQAGAVSVEEVAAVRAQTPE